jgi:hypothetical protein
VIQNATGVIIKDGKFKSTVEVIAVLQAMGEKP